MKLEPANFQTLLKKRLVFRGKAYKIEMKSKLPVKRSLRLEDPEIEKQNGTTPVKKQCLPGYWKAFSPTTGTCQMSPAHPCPTSAGKRKGSSDNNGITADCLKKQMSVTQTERLRTALQASAKNFLKAREQLEMLLPVEGSCELESFFSRESADLQAELHRHRDLIAQMEEYLNKNGIHLSRLKDSIQHGSSYDFLKSVMN
ncbi:centromere protein R isoform X1 [Lepisosteus oculatus]|uniref:centromere protein R isoform X1 n=1 Tax=Lepisosteus oculatus TaxID=7918 RepID=UPI003721CD65